MDTKDIIFSSTQCCRWIKIKKKKKKKKKKKNIIFLATYHSLLPFSVSLCLSLSLALLLSLSTSHLRTFLTRICEDGKALRHKNNYLRIGGTWGGGAHHAHNDVRMACVAVREQKACIVRSQPLWLTNSFFLFARLDSGGPSSPCQQRSSPKPTPMGGSAPRHRPMALDSAASDKQRYVKLVGSLVIGFAVCLHMRMSISGTTPAVQRKALGQLLSQRNIKVFVENARVLARKVQVGEDIYEAAKRHNIQIIPEDLPSLMNLQPNPGEAFVRRIMFAVYELERDLIVERLRSGLLKKKALSRKRTQSGNIKYNGIQVNPREEAPHDSPTPSSHGLHQAASAWKPELA